VKLGEKPVIRHANLNQWLTFTKPGHYALRAGSRRITPLGQALLEEGRKEEPPVWSNSIELTILGADAGWFHDQISEIRGILNSSPGPQEREAAERRLRYLRTREAAEELARYFVRAEEVEDIICELDSGLFESPFPEAAIPILEQALGDVHAPVRSRIVGMLAELAVKREFGGRPPATREGGDEALRTALEDRAGFRRRFEETYSAILLESLRQRSGAARATAAWALWGQQQGRSNADDGSQSALISMLWEEVVSAAPDLPANVQIQLLEWDWKPLPHQPLLPSIRQMALHDENSSHRTLTLQRWCEIDPKECVAPVLAEIAKPGPLPPLLLTLVPAGERPEFDPVLRERLHTEQAARNWYGVATLIRQYASSKLVPDVREALEGPNRTPDLRFRTGSPCLPASSG